MLSIFTLLSLMLVDLAAAGKSGQGHFVELELKSQSDSGKKDFFTYFDPLKGTKGRDLQRNDDSTIS